MTANGKTAIILIKTHIHYVFCLVWQVSITQIYYIEMLVFPVQIRTMKHKYKLKYGITDEILDGSYESICKMIYLFWKSDDKRCVVAFDAVSVNAKISINQNRQVEGLFEELTIDKKLADLISENLDEFHNFYEEHHNEILKYFFAFYVL